MQQACPRDTVDGHERAASSDGKASPEEIGVELHIGQNEVEELADAGGVGIGRDRDLAVPGKLGPQTLVNVPCRAAIVRTFHAIGVLEFDYIEIDTVRH